MRHQFFDLSSSGLDMVDDQLIEIGILMLIVDKQHRALTRVDLGNVYGELAFPWKYAAGSTTYRCADTACHQLSKSPQGDQHLSKMV